MLRFALLATWLPPQRRRENFLAHAALAQNNEDYVQQEVALSGSKHEKQSANLDFVPGPVAQSTVPSSAPKDAPEESGVVISRDKAIFGSKNFLHKKTLLAIVLGLFLVSGALALKERILPKRLPPELALQVESALALRPDAEALAKAVATDEAGKAYRRAEKFLLEVQNAAKEAETKVGKAREKAILHMRNNLSDAKSALKALHEETKEAGARAIQAVPPFMRMAVWYESIKRLGGENEYIEAARVMLASIETAAGSAFKRSELACQQLESASFDSLENGKNVLQKSLKDFEAVQHAGKEILQLSSWAEEIQGETLKTIIDDQKIRRRSTLFFLQGKLEAGFDGCETMLNSLKSTSGDKTNSRIDVAVAQIRQLKDNYVSLVAAHNEVIASMCSAENPDQYANFTAKARSLENDLNKMALVLWGQAGEYAHLLKDTEAIFKLQLKHVDLECDMYEMKADEYKKVALEKILRLQEILRMRFFDGGREPSSRFLSAELVNKLEEEAEILSQIIKSQARNVETMINNTKEWARANAAPSEQNDDILKALEQGVTKVDALVVDLINSCQEGLHMHMESKFLTIVEDYFQASQQTVKTLGISFAEDLGDAAQVVEGLMAKFEKAMNIAGRAPTVLMRAQAAAAAGVFAFKLEDVDFKFERRRK